MSGNCESEKVIGKLMRNFYRGFLGFSLQDKDVKVMSWDIQERFLDLTVNSKRLQKYPVNKNFSKLYFKKLIDLIQSQQEIHDDFFTFLCSAMSVENIQDNKFSYRHYLINNDLEKVITIKETNNMVVNGTTGLKTWEAALMLTDWALCNKDIFEHKTILELGCGVGLTGIAIANFCDVSSMYLTDCHEEVLRTICENIEINFSNLKKEENKNNTLFKDKTMSIGVLPLDWNFVEEIPVDLLPNVVIGADIVYDPSILQPLCNIFRCLFQRNKDLVIYIQSVIRNEDTFGQFTNFLDKNQFNYEDIKHSEPVLLQWDNTIKSRLLKIYSC